MAAAKEVPMADDELDALMAELEAETANMVAPPKAVVAAPAPEPDLDISDADLAELEEATQPVAAAAPEPAPTPEVDADAELAALEAELSEAELSEAEVVPAAAAPAPTPEPEPAPVVKLTGIAALEAAQAAVEEECPTPAAAAPEAEPNPKPARKSPQLQFYLDVESFKKDIAVSDTNLDNAMMEQAGSFAWHAAQLARAEAQYARVKLRFEGIEAKTYSAHRKAILASGEKATEKMVENEVRVDPEYIQAKNLVIEAEMLVGFNKAAVEALRHRKDMIVQLGADRREEYKGQTRILNGDEAHASVKERALRAAS